MEMLVVIGLALVVLMLARHAAATAEQSRRARAKQRTPPVRPKQMRAPKRGLPRPHVLEPAPAPRGSKLAGRAWVIDGDTISIGRTKIRLAGIDAPEVDMPFGQKSKWAMVRLCKGQRVTALMHGETSYDRQVATVFLEDGRDAGAELVKQGLALDLAFFSGGKYRAFEPPGARKRLAYGNFGHRSLRVQTRR